MAVVSTNADTAPFRNGFVSKRITFKNRQMINYQSLADFLIS